LIQDFKIPRAFAEAVVNIRIHDQYAEKPPDTADPEFNDIAEATEKFPTNYIDHGTFWEVINK